MPDQTQPSPPPSADLLGGRALYGEPAFGNLLTVAAEHYGLPAVVFALLEADRPLVGASLGLDTAMTEQALWFCAHVAAFSTAASSAAATDGAAPGTGAGPGLVVLSDAAREARFGGAAGEPFVRFCAGVPVCSASGRLLGTLAVFDTAARAGFDAGMLHTVAASLAQGLDLHRSVLRNRYQAHILSDIQDAVMVFDNEVRLEYANEAACRLYGILPEDYGRPGVAPFSVRWLSAQDEREATSSALTTEVWRGQVIHVLRSGREIRVGLTLQPVLGEAGRRRGTVGIIRDLTEERERERQRLLAEQVEVETTDAVFIASPNPGAGPHVPGRRLYFLHVNAAFVRLTGFGLDEIVADVEQLCGPQTDREALRELFSAYQERRPTRVEVVVYDRSGRPLWVECSVNTAVLGGDEHPYWIGVVRDISAQVRRRTLDRDRRRLLEAALRQSRAEVMPLVVGMLEGQFPGMQVALLLNVPGEVASTMYGSAAFAAELGLTQMAALRRIWSEQLGKATASRMAELLEPERPGPDRLEPPRDAGADTRVYARARHCWSFPLVTEANGVLGVLSLLSGERPAVGQDSPSGQPPEIDDADQELLEDTARLVAVILERERALQNFKTLARADTLTGLPNASRFDEVLASRLEHGLGAAEQATAGERLVVGLLDLDRFKEVNDTLGHASGDGLLKGVAERLSGVLRPGELVARMGGDEFLLLLRLEQDQALSEVAERLRSVLEQPVGVSGRELFVHASIGLAVYPDDAREAGELKRLADGAMYVAKRQGLGWTRAGHGVAARTPLSLSLETDLHRALERGELFLAYQPLVEARSQVMTGVEALLRWQHPALGTVSPAEFIPIAEANGLIVPFGAWMMQQAMRQAVVWQERCPDLQLHLNLSARQFLHPGLPELVGGLLQESGVPPERVTLEITEGTLLDPQSAQDILSRLRHLGLHLAIDDFGTGYSSLAYLKQFPIQSLKIDKSFIDGLREAGGSRAALGASSGTPSPVAAATGNSTDAKIVRSLIGLAQSLGLSTVAEGVETQAQAQALAQMGCDTLQGYLFSRPLSPEGIDEYLQAAVGEADASRTGPLA